MTIPFRFVDTHTHLWDLATGWYPVFEAHPGGQVERSSPLIGDFSSLVGKDYLLKEYFEDAKAFNVTKMVHVTAAQQISNWADETLWLQDLFDRQGHPHGIIGFVDLAQPVDGVAGDILQHCAAPAFRGIRSPGELDFASDHVADVFEIIQRHGLIFDLISHENTHPDAAQFVARFPDMQFVLEHTGWPRRADRATFDEWRSGIRQIAKAANTTCKISGLGMAMRNWTVADLRPWIEETIAVFGADRCMFATNFPVDGLYSTFEALMNAFIEITSGFSDTERDALFAANAERIYRI